MQGNLSFKDPVNLRINGRFEGNLEVRGTLAIGSTAIVKADILGDNIIEKSIRKDVEAFQKQPCGAKILIKKVHDPERFGVVEFKRDTIVSIQEKPKRPI